ncbi:MAG TPA: pyrimidine reductase family protein [Jatrophihabitantaceae bacterium]
MSERAEMIGMRALLPEPRSEVDLHQHYARHWLDRGGIRANFISSVDGAVEVAGLSRGLQTPGDNRVFAVLRDLADVILVGAGTARLEGYAVVALNAERRAVRQDFGLAPELPTAIVSRSLQVDPAGPLFAEGGPRTIVFTAAAADPAMRAQLESRADVVICGDDVVDLGAARAALADRGLTRVLCEGGPTLFADLAAGGQMDELCLTLSPLLAGPGAGRITSGASWPLDRVGRSGLSLDGLLEEDGALFGRYLLGSRAG